MYLLKFLINFLGPYVDLSLRVPYKFPSALNRYIS